MKFDRSLFIALSVAALVLIPAASGVSISITGGRSLNIQGSGSILGIVAENNRAQFFVGPGGSIQGAVGSADPGDIIRLASGNYYENVFIDKPLTLIGAGRGDNPKHNTIITADDTAEPVIDITSGNVVVKDLQVTGANTVNNNNIGYGICIEGSGNINGVTLRNIASKNNLAGLGVYANGNTISNINANGIIISGSGWYGVNAYATAGGTISGLSLDNTRISGVVNGVEAWAEDGGTISDLSLDNARISGSGEDGVYAFVQSGGTISDMSLGHAQISGSVNNGVSVFALKGLISNINLNHAKIYGSKGNGVVIEAFGSGARYLP